ncbi:hypothetical protein M493_12540 [Geobacillus genomosp. 3]|uniref:Uncharacterized protein n=1 Tax=Geobacillus genomosp. 3 TaxID=1921421 RepID=S5ZEM4_GEOG3|nr:hypothetical protein M493_12540 [Geobacillus genomosp. 3]
MANFVVYVFLDESKHEYKWGRYGVGKYVYRDEEERELEETIRSYIAHFFPAAEVQYFT